MPSLGEPFGQERPAPLRDREPSRCIFLFSVAHLFLFLGHVTGLDEVVEQEGHRHHPEVVPGGYLHTVEPISGKRLLDKMTLAIYDLLIGEAFGVMVGMMAVMAEDDQIVVGIVRSIPVEVVLSENLNASNTTNRARIVGLDVQAFVKVHLVCLPRLRGWPTAVFAPSVATLR